MEIINNLTSKNHFKRISKLFSKSSKTIIASPYLMSDFTDFLNSVSILPNSKIELITTLQPNSIEQIGKINSLLSFCRHPSIHENNIDLKISINNKLHGKVYFFKIGNTRKAIISSANFTQNGLAKNHEWGIEISEENQIEIIKNDLMNSIEKEGLTLTELKNMKEACDIFQEKVKIPNQKIQLNLISLIPTETSFTEFPETTKFWLKPVGVTGEPILEGRKFESLERKLNFSTKKRPNINIGDILICYGVGAKQILSVYRVEELPALETIDELNKEPRKERWAWYVIGKNLTPNFGREWWKHNLNAFGLVEDFKQINPNISITNVGGNTLGGLNFGSDKLFLKREFAEFIIEKVISKNRKKVSTDQSN
jgi:hypothetical protein